MEIMKQQKIYFKVSSLVEKSKLTRFYNKYNSGMKKDAIYYKATYYFY